MRLGIAQLSNPLPDIESILEGFVVTLLEWFTEIFIEAFNRLVEGVKDIILSTPYPEDGSGEPVIFNPRSASTSTGDLNQIWGELLNTQNVYDETILPTAVVLFLLAFSLAYVAKILEGMPAVAQFQPDLSKVFFLFLVTLVWLSVLTGATALANEVGNALGNAGTISGTCGNGSSMTGSSSACTTDGNTNPSSLITVVITLILFWTATLMLIGGALLWAFRYVLLFVLGLAMPIILGLKAFEEVNFPFVDEAAEYGWELFWFAVFANIPAALVFLVGGVASTVAGQLGGGTTGLIGDVISVMIEAAIPILALFAPFYMLKNTKAGSQAVQVAGGAASSAVEAGAAVASGGTTAVASGAAEAAEELADSDSSKRGAVTSGLKAGGVNALNEMTDDDSTLRRVWQGQRRARNAAGAVSAAARGEDASEALGQESALEKYDRTGEFSSGAAASGGDGGDGDGDEMEVDPSEEFADVIGSSLQRVQQARVGAEAAGNDIDRMAIEAEDETIESAEKIGYDAGDFRTFQRRLAREGIDEEYLLEEGYDGDFAEELELAADTSMSANDIDELRENAEDIDTLSKQALTNNAKSLVTDDDVVEAVGGRDELEEFIEEAQETTIKQNLREAGDAINLDEEDVDQIVDNTGVDNMQDLAEIDPEQLASDVPWGIDEDRAAGIVGYAQQEMVMEQFGDATGDSMTIDDATEGTLRSIIGTEGGYDVENPEELLGKYAATGGNAEEFVEEAGGAIGDDIEGAKIERAMDELASEVEDEVEQEREPTPDSAQEVRQALDVESGAADRISRETGPRFGGPDSARDKLSGREVERIEELALESGAGKNGADIMMEARLREEDGRNVNKSEVVNEIAETAGISEDAAEEFFEDVLETSETERNTKQATYDDLGFNDD